MFRRTLPGVFILSVCLCSIGLQLPTQVGKGSYFGVFGAETIPVLDPLCNGIGLKSTNCNINNSLCANVKYDNGPLSADPGGVNTKRFDKNPQVVQCISSIGGNLKMCPDTYEYKETPGNCTQTMVFTDE